MREQTDRKRKVEGPKTKTKFTENNRYFNF